jgi:hypothetical protein
MRKELVMCILLSSATALAQPVAIPTGDVDLTLMATANPTLNSVRLVKWRTGQPNMIQTTGISDLSVAYLTVGSTLAFPSRSTVGDNSANDQGSLWTDNALEVDFQKGNQLNQAILIFTDNQVVPSSNDNLGTRPFKGGLIGGAGCLPSDPCWANRGSILPLIWKAVTLDVLLGASNASSALPIATTSPLFMPTQILDPNDNPNCPAEGPYPASQRPSQFAVGFCDYSTHFFIDKNNTDPDHLFYDQYPSGDIRRQDAFRYSSLVGPFGINTQESGIGGGGSNSPMYAVLGVNVNEATQTKSATTIFVEVLQM